METIIEIIKPAATVIAVIVPLFMKLISDNKKKKKRSLALEALCFLMNCSSTSMTATFQTI